MARSVTYSVVPRMKPGDKNLPPKYYAQAQARGDVNIREMAERIQSTCTVHKSDVYAVLVALEDMVAEAIQNGEIVRLGDLCTLQVSLKGRVPSPKRITTKASSSVRKSISVRAEYWPVHSIPCPSARCLSST